MTQESNIFPYIARLLQGAEVVWKPLGEVAELKRGTTITKKTSNEGIYPVISGGQQPAYYIDQFNRDGETITVAGSGAYAGFVMYWNEPIFVGDAFSIKANEEQVLPRYIYHFLLNIQEKIYDLKSGGGVPHVYAKDVARFVIPLPPLSAQQEIVRILDKFTNLEAELEAELESRKRQYEYYRNKLLNFNEIGGGIEIVWKTLGEVATFRRGSFPQPYTKSEWYGGDNSMPFVQVADMKDNRFNLVSITKQRISQLAMPKSIFVPKGTILVSLQGTIGRVAITQYDSYVDRTIAIFTHINNEIDIRYFAYQLQLIFGIKKENARGSTIKTITKEEFSAFLIPLPPLSEQQRIATILDKFDTLVNSISEGLPKEIALRRKQYEYYREQLLRF